jgi:enamine deaminase RidA (YjgF/YER057c/UK114 family)
MSVLLTYMRALAGAPMRVSHGDVVHGETAMSNETPEQRLAALGLTLPQVPKPIGNYVPWRVEGNMLWTSGQGPRRPDGMPVRGKVPSEMSIEDAYHYARMVGLGLLAAAAEGAGGLAKLKAVKVLGMVNAGTDFDDHPKVINGCSDLFVAVLGENGKHARSAVGFASLPNRIPVEIEAIFRILD